MNLLKTAMPMKGLEHTEKPIARVVEGSSITRYLTDTFFNVSFSVSEEYSTGRLLPIPFSHHLILSC